MINESFVTRHLRLRFVWIQGRTIHCIVPVERELEVFNSAAKRWPISEFYGSNLPFFYELNFCFREE